MSAKSKDTIDPFQKDCGNLRSKGFEMLNDDIPQNLSRKEIEEIDFRVIGNFVLARAKTLSRAVNRELLEPISRWLIDPSWLERFKACEKEIPDWSKYKRQQRLWTKQQRALAAERLKAYRQAIIKKRKLRHELSKIVGKTSPRGGYSHQFRSGFMVPIVSPFSPTEQNKRETKQRFLQSYSLAASDLLPWKLLITTALKKPKKLGDLKNYCSDQRLDSVCKMIHLLQMESEGKIRLIQNQSFGEITLERLEKHQNTNIKITDEHGKNYDFDWQNLTDAQRTKIITDIHTHRILCQPV